VDRGKGPHMARGPWRRRLSRRRARGARGGQFARSSGAFGRDCDDGLALDPGAAIPGAPAETGSVAGAHSCAPLLRRLVAGMRLAPRLNAGDRGRSPVVVAILRLGQPLGLADELAGRPTGGPPAVALVAGISRVGREDLPAARTGPPSFLPHVASPARSPIWLENTPGRTPKKTPPGKKTPGRYRSEEEEDGQEGPVSPRQIYASFRSAATQMTLGFVIWPVLRMLAVC
jgi:hypothetical protein